MTNSQNTAEVDFRQIPGVEGYRFLWDGRVQSCWEGHGPGSHLSDKWHDLKPTKPPKRRYYTICIKRDGKRFKAAVHPLMCEAWWGPKPDPRLECCHKNDDAANNRPDNLYWGTRQHNHDDRSRNGLQIKGERCYQAKVTEEKVIAIRLKYATGEYTLQQLADEYGLVFQTVSDIIRRKSWKHVA